MKRKSANNSADILCVRKLLQHLHNLSTASSQPFHIFIHLVDETAVIYPHTEAVVAAVETVKRCYAWGWHERLSFPAGPMKKPKSTPEVSDTYVKVFVEVGNHAASQLVIKLGKDAQERHKRL